MINSLLQNHPFDRPPLPNREEDEMVFGQDYPNDGQLLNIMASGAAVITSVLLGLQSFSGRGEIFGSLGRAMENPTQALNDFILRARGLLAQNDQLDAATGTLLNKSLNKARLRQIALKNIESGKEQSRRIKQYMAIRQETALVNLQEEAARRAGKLARIEDNAVFRRAYKRYQLQFPGIAFPTGEKSLRVHAMLDPVYYQAVQADYRAQTATSNLDPTNPVLRANAVPAKRLHLGQKMLNKMRGVGYNMDRVLIPMSGGKASDIFYHDRGSGQLGLADEMANILHERFRTMPEIDGLDFNFSIQKVNLADGDNHAFRIKVEAGGNKVEKYIPLPDQFGVYHKPNYGIPETGKQVLLFSNDLFSNDPMFSAARNRRPIRTIVNPSELALMKIGQLLTKMRNDLIDKQSPEAVGEQIQRIIDEAFDSTSPIGNSLGDMINKGNQVSPQHMRFFKSLENETKRRRIQNGLQNIERMERLHTAGARYFSVDTEFVSPETAVGQNMKATTQAKGRTVYEVGGTIFEADPYGTPKALAEISYKPQLFQTSDVRRMTKAEKELWEGVQKFQLSHVGQNTAEIKRTLDTLSKGELKVKLMHDGQEYEIEATAKTSKIKLKGKELSRKDAPSWLQRRSSESFEGYYLRLQSELLDRNRTRFTLGQNIASSDLGILQNLYGKHSLKVSDVLDEANIIDTLDMAHVFSPNDVSSRSLGNITAAFFDLTEQEYLEALRAAKKHLEAGQSLLTPMDPMFSNAFRHNKDAIKRIGKFYQKTHKVLESLKGGSMHTAVMDAHITGQFTLPNLYRFSQDEGGKYLQELSRDALNAQGSLAGRVEFFNRYLPDLYSDDGSPNSLNMVLANQMGASFGTASMVHPGVLFFHKLQNSGRQLYQRIKPMFLNRSRSRTERKKGYTEIKNAFFDPTSPSELHRLPSTIPYGKDGKRLGNVLYAGFGSMTAMEQALHGRSLADDMAVQAFGAMLLDDHHLVAESRGLFTPSVMDYTSQAMNVKTHGGVAVDLNALDGQTVKTVFHTAADDVVIQSNTAEGFIKSGLDSLRKAGLNLSTAEFEDRATAHLRQIYYLSSLAEDSNVTISKGVRNLIKRSIDHQKRMISGENISHNTLLKEAFRRYRKGDGSLILESHHQALFDMTGDMSRASVLGRLAGPGESNALGLNISIQLDPEEIEMTDDGTYRLKGHKRIATIRMDYIDDPSTLNKFIVGGTVKVGAGMVPVDALGYQGEQFLVGAAFEKLKREDVAGMIRAQSDRLRRAATIELRIIEESAANKDIDAATALRRKDDVFARTASALKKLTGTDMSVGQIKNHVLVKRGEDGIDFVFDNMMQAHPERISILSFISAAKEMNLTYDSVLDTLPQHRRGEARAMQRAQIENLIKSLESERDSLKATQLIEGFDDTIRQLRKSLTNEDLFKNTGALFDIWTSYEDNSIHPAYQVLTSIFAMQRPMTGGSLPGTPFERLTGRVTLQGRLSALSSAITLRSGTSLSANLGSQAFQMWMATKTGFAMFSDQKFQQEIARAVKSQLKLKSIDLKKLTVSKGEYFYNGVKLKVNPHVQANAMARTGAALLESLGSINLTSTHSVFDLRTDSRQYSVDDFMRQFGRSERAALHHQYGNGDLLSEEAAKAFDKSYAYVAASDIKKIPFLSGDYDLVRLRMFSKLDDAELNKVRQLMLDSGMSVERVDQLLGGDTIIEEALAAGKEISPTERHRLQAMLRTGGRRGYVRPSIVLPALTGTFLPQYSPTGEGILKFNLPQTHRQLFEFLSDGPISQVEEAVYRIHALAQRLPDKPTAQHLAVFKRQVIDQVFDSPTLDRAAASAQGLYSSTLRYLSKNLLSQGIESMGSYLGGYYNVASSQFDMIPHLRILSQHFQAEGPTAGFKSTVRQMLNKSTLRDYNKKEMDEAVDIASRSLHKYISNQPLGDNDYYRWRGFGVSEGFMGQQNAEALLSKMKTQYQALERMGASDLANLFDEGLGKDDLLQRARKEINMVEQAIRNPGSNDGILTIDARQPDFAALWGNEFQKKQVLADEALIALGKDPRYVFANGNPLSMAMMRGDFDYDILFSAVVDDPITAQMLREGNAKKLTAQMASFYRVLQRHDPDGGIPFEILKDGRVVTNPQTTSEFYKGNTIMQRLGAPGYAIGMASTGYSRRVKQAAQQALIGTFGSYSKRGAIAVDQMSTAFTDITDQLLAMDTDDPKNLVRTVFGETDLNAIYKARQGIEDARSLGGDLDLLHRAILGQSDIGQRIAIEKYKSGDVIDRARRVDDALGAIWGKRNTRFAGKFNEAFDALIEASPDVLDFFYQTDLDEGIAESALNKRLRGRARQAYKAIYDTTQAMQLITSRGITDDYFSAANMKPGEMSPATALSMASPDMMDSAAGYGSANRNAINALRSALNLTDDQAVRFTSALLEFQGPIFKEAGPDMFTRMGNYFRDMTPGSQKIGLAMGAGMALLALAPAPQTRADSERYDLPQRYSRKHIQKTLQAMQQEELRALGAYRVQPTAGRAYQASRPTTQVDYF